MNDMDLETQIKAIKKDYIITVYDTNGDLQFVFANGNPVEKKDIRKNPIEAPRGIDGIKTTQIISWYEYSPCCIEHGKWRWCWC